jgi:diguanylate cyclase (GGDEF)-like protein/PAS domain S-box-containing protein
VGKPDFPMRLDDPVTAEAESMVWRALDGLAASACVVDGDGRILLANRNWDDFARANGGAGADVSVGANYARACRAAAESDDGAARLAAAQMLDVIEGRRESGVVEYACDAPGKPRWFVASAMSFLCEAQRRVLIVHVQIEERIATERLRSLMGLYADWYWILDRDLRYVLITGQGDERNGTASASLLGQRRFHDREFQALDMSNEAFEALHLRGESYRDVRARIAVTGGGHRIISLSGEPLRDARGDVTGYQGITRDITREHSAEKALRESEERFRGLLNLTSDFYWETDASHRLTARTAGAVGESLAALGGGALLGKRRWEVPSVYPDEEGWRRHWAVLDDHLPFRNFEIAQRAADGRVFHLSISGEPVFGEGGTFLGYRGVGSDISERKQEERLVALEHAVSRCLAEARGAGPAMLALIRTVCEIEGWDYGRYWKLDDAAAVLRYGQAWGRADPEIVGHLESTRGLTFRPGQGLVGIAFETGRPLVTPDLARDPRVLQEMLADAAGLRGACALPVSAEGRTIGVLAFVGRVARQIDERLVNALAAIGTQAGIFLQREEAAAVLRESETRFRDLVALSSDFHWETDELHRLTQRTEGGAAESFAALGGSAVLGKARWELPYVHPGEEGWRAHREVLDAHAPFRDFEFARRAQDGRVFHFTISGLPVFGGDGRFLGYRGIGSDISARKRVDALVALEHAVARCLAEEEDVHRAVENALRAICQSRSVDCARLYVADENGAVLQSFADWSIDDAAIRQYVERTRTYRLGYGEGVCGEVWKSRVPAWIPDIAADSRSWNRDALAACGLRSAFVMPVIVRGQCVGVLAFLGRVLLAPDDRIHRTAEAIGAQIGQHLLRARAQLALRLNEERFRSLTELSSDWYWEQDEELRFRRFSGVDFNGKWGAEQERTLGMRRWELPGVTPIDGSWEAHRADVDARRPFRDFQYRRVLEGGEVQYVSASGEPTFDEAGRFTGYRGVASDITERKRAERLREIEHAIARALAGGHDGAGDWLEEVMLALCEAMEGDCARYFELDEEAGVMRYAGGAGPDQALVRRYWELTGKREFGRDEGVLGQVWRSGEPAWVADIERDGRFRNVAAAREVGLKSVFVSPVIADGRTIGLISIFSRQVRLEDRLIMQSARAIGSQLGQFLARKRDEERLLRFRAALDVSADAVLLIDRTTMRYLDVNRTFCELVGYSREEVLRMTPMDIFSADRAALERDYDALIADPAHQARFVRGSYRRKDGREVAIETHRRALRGKDGWLIVGSARDITARLAQERRQERLAVFGQYALKRRGTDELIREAVVQIADQVDAVAFFEETAHGRLLLRAANGTGTDTTVGLAVPIAASSAARQVLSEGRTVTVDAAYLANIPAGWPWGRWMRGMASGAFVPVTHNGHTHGVLAVFSRAADGIGAGETRFAESVAHVLSTALQREEAEKRLAFLAQFDALTGLPNRSLVEDRITQTLARSSRAQRHAAVLFVDLDRFKLVNDSLGHPAGDQLIRQVARRLETCIRAGDTVGRISGDEFAIVLADLARPEDAGAVAQKVLDALSRPFNLEGSEAAVGASIGISVSPGDAQDAATLLRNADTAMYRVKKSTRNGFRYFTAKMNERQAARLLIATDLRRALERREFLLHYQPKVDLHSGALTGMEALLRWNRPGRGLVSPAEFIPALEESGLILPVGDWVLAEACAQLRRWQAAGLAPVPVAVNISAKQFRRQDLDGVVQREIAAAGVGPGMIELEITESSLADDPDDAVRILRNLSDAGLKISVDDFGTGYSSLAYLTRLPLSALKVDRSFVRDAAEKPAAASIVRAIVDMAHNLDFIVVAEGVESEWQAQFLRICKCDQAQGFLYGRPEAAEEIVRRLPAGAPVSSGRA